MRANAIHPCPSCGARLRGPMGRCTYCGAQLGAAAQVEDAAPSDPTFGFGKRFFVASMVVAFGIYGAGWPLEDPTYWLSDASIAVWAGAVPLWLLISATLLRIRGPVWLIGFAFGLILLLIHMGVMWGMRGRFNDDYAGIAAMYGGAAAGGWLLGRGLRRVIGKFGD